MNTEELAMDGHSTHDRMRERIQECINQMNALCDEVAKLREDITTGEAEGRSDAPHQGAQPHTSSSERGPQTSDNHAAMRQAGR